MQRPVYEPTGTLTEIEQHLREIAGPARFIFVNPRRGGPRLSELRALFTRRGLHFRFSGTLARIFVDVDAVPLAAPLVALDSIARSDARGLERVLLSALPHVDEIVLGIDGRSDDETVQVAEAYADVVWRFQAVDIGLSDEEWANNKIHFANARNLGRQRVKAPWALFLDSDEYLARPADFREKVRTADKVGAFGIRVRVATFEQHDHQRLARTEYRWWSASHNQLAITGDIENLDALIVHDTSLRAETEITRRTQQRESGIEDLEKAAAEGQLPALFHVAKHKLGARDPKAIDIIQDYRFKAEPHGPLADERAYLALLAAIKFYEDDDFTNAELWCLRAMLDGPYVDAMCLLGDIAEDQGDLALARAWYEAACAVPETHKLRFATIADLRWGRRDGIRLALASGPLSPWQREGVFKVQIDAFDDYFLRKVRELGGVGTTAVVRLKPYDEFIVWAAQLRAGGLGVDSRVLPAGVQALADSGETPTVDNLIASGVEELGVPAYVDEMVRAIVAGENIPPLVTKGGKPADGRHRALAARKMGLVLVPVMEIDEMPLAQGEEQSEAGGGSAEADGDGRPGTGVGDTQLVAEEPVAEVSERA